MATIRAPDDFGVSSYNLDCDSCQAGATLSHCGRCGNGMYLFVFVIETFIDGIPA
jgi:hypothetical protein